MIWHAKQPFEGAFASLDQGHPASAEAVLHIKWHANLGGNLDLQGHCLKPAGIKLHHTCAS